MGANRCCDSQAESVPSSHRLQNLHLSNFWRTQGSIWGDKSLRDMCWDLLWDGSARSLLLLNLWADVRAFPQELPSSQGPPGLA